MEIINRLRKIANALDKAGSITQADFIDKNMIVLAMLARNKMKKITKKAGIAEDEVQRLFLSLLSGTKFANKVHSVGGFERDRAMGIPSKDLDIVIDSPKGGGAKEFAWFLHNTFSEQTVKPWPQGGKEDDTKEKKTYPIFGISFTEDVEYDGKKYKTTGAELDIADSQKEVFKDYSSRQRETFPATIEEDNHRRDFTVNMLMRDLTNGELIDLTGHSLKDIEEGVLRHKDWVSMEESFDQDPLRIMRLIRFKVKYDWHVPYDVLSAASKYSQRLKIVSWERITGELKKIAEVGKLYEAIPFMREIGVLSYVLPEVHAMIGLIQKHKGKEIDIYQHTLMVLSKAPPTIEGQFSALLHDIGKITTSKTPKEVDKTQSPSHPKVGEEITRAIMDRLKFDKETSNTVSKLVGLHMRPRKLQEASVKELRQFVREIGKDMIESLLDLAKADALGRLPPKENYIPKLRKKLEEAMEIPIEDKSILNGNEIQEILNIKPGPIISKVMSFLKNLSDEKAEEGIVLNKEEAEQAVLKEFGKEQEASDSRGILSGPVGSTGAYFVHYTGEANLFYGPFENWNQAKNAGFLCMPQIDLIDNIIVTDWDKEIIDYIKDNDEEERARDEGENPRFFKSPYESQWKDNPLVQKYSLQWSDIEKILLDNRRTDEYILNDVTDYKTQDSDDAEFNDFISELEQGKFQFVNTYSDNSRKESPYNSGGRGPMLLNEVPGPQ